MALAGRHVKTWHDFRSLVRELRNEFPRRSLFFRGQGDSCWPLRTTLERRRVSDVGDSVRKYYFHVHRMHSDILSATGVDWRPPNLDEIASLTRDYDRFSMAMMGRDLPGLDYLGYLRQHGFPSPLLDWTFSPYIAAFFAFRPSRQADRAIYVFLKSEEGLTHWGSDSTAIFDVGWGAGRHRRHFLQRSVYTLCARFDQEEWRFVEHESATNDPEADQGRRQDLLWKITLPHQLRREVLAELDEHNLNAYSLFVSDEALMETLEERSAFQV